MEDAEEEAAEIVERVTRGLGRAGRARMKRRFRMR